MRKNTCTFVLVIQIVIAFATPKTIRAFTADGGNSGITYYLNGGRLGDNLLNYIHARWLSYYLNLPFHYVSFEKSEQFALHEDGQKSAQKRDYAHRIFFNGKQPFDYTQIDQHANTLYAIPYFPEKGIEGTLYHFANWPFYFETKWNDPGFKSLIRQLFKPRFSLALVTPPPGAVTIAVHVRTGGAFDSVWCPRTAPAKFLTNAYYFEGLQKIVRLNPSKKIYAHIFTDHERPSVLADTFKNFFAHDPHVEFGCRTHDNAHDKNVLEDFFSMITFDYIVRSDANLAIIASKIGDFKMIIAPYDLKNTILYSPHEASFFYPST